MYYVINSLSCLFATKVSANHGKTLFGLLASPMAFTQTLTDTLGNPISSTNPLAVNPAESGAIHIGYNQVSVSSSTATQIVVANATRRAIVIVNSDASITMFVGDASVATTTGIPLKAGAAITIPTVAAVYAKAASGSPVAGYLEIYD